MSHSNVSEELLHLRKRARRRLVGAVALVIFALIVLWTALDNAPPPRFSTGNPVEIVSSAPALTAQRASLVAVVEPANTPPLLNPPPDAAAVTPVTAPAVAAEPAPASAPVVAKAVQPPRVVNGAEVLPGKLVNRQSPPVQAKAVPAPTPAAKPKPAENAPATFDPKKILEGKVDPTEPTAKPAQLPGKYYVQIGAFADAAKIKQLTTKLKGAGLPVQAEKVKTSKGELTRIRVGPAADAAKAEAYRKKAESVGVNGKVVK
ncbi:DedD protein [Formivibrio citricus]|uniref:DedD protein n=1 Tax=Formivibrio citricus TaxID=83765 RepID=A0A1I4V9F6_9NEIS|nr:SPOR domain-containing protein [Formivibrio citricus]SFM97813.1 DedD protein [Formivibrio citricus]